MLYTGLSKCCVKKSVEMLTKESFNQNLQQAIQRHEKETCFPFH